MELDQVLAQIDSLKTEAENLQPVKPEYERTFWEKFRLEFNYNSNHMEGNTLTYGHTQILLRSGNVVGKYNIRELEEMKAHDLALKIIRESAGDSEFQLSQKFIKEINQIILVEPFYNEAITESGQPTQKLITPGEYKKTPNSVRLPNGEMFYYPSPEETPALMSDLMDWYRKESENKELHPVQIAALFHYKIVRIHPFDDSNGRTARLLMNYILMKNGFAPLVIESNDKKNYLIALTEADAGNIEAFISYTANLALRWQEFYVKAINGESIEEAKDLDKKIEILKKKLSNEDEIELKKELGIIQKITTESIIPFLLYLEKEIGKIAEFFFESKIQIQGGGNNRTQNTMSEIIRSSSDFANNLLSSNNAFKIKFLHKGLKKSGLRNWGYSTTISMTFKDYEYRIDEDSLDYRIIKSYKEPLKEDDYSAFVKRIVEKEYGEIESKLTNK